MLIPVRHLLGLNITVSLLISSVSLRPTADGSVSTLVAQTSLSVPHSTVAVTDIAHTLLCQLHRLAPCRPREPLWITGQGTAAHGRTLRTATPFRPKTMGFRGVGSKLPTKKAPKPNVSAGQGALGVELRRFEPLTSPLGGHISLSVERCRYLDFMRIFAPSRGTGWLRNARVFRCFRGKRGVKLIAYASRNLHHRHDGGRVPGTGGKRKSGRC